MGGEQSSAMAEGAVLVKRWLGELDEGMSSGSGEDGRAQDDNRRDGYGQRMGPSPEVRAPAAPLVKNACSQTLSTCCEFHFPLDRQRCRCPCELTAHGGLRAYRCTHTFGGL